MNGAEYEGAVPLGGDLGEQLESSVELGRPHAAVVGVDEGRVERELAQRGQRGQDREPVRGRVVDEAEDALTLPGRRVS